MKFEFDPCENKREGGKMHTEKTNEIELVSVQSKELLIFVRIKNVNKLKMKHLTIE